MFYVTAGAGPLRVLAVPGHDGAPAAGHGRHQPGQLQQAPRHPPPAAALQLPALHSGEQIYPPVSIISILYLYPATRHTRLGHTTPAAGQHLEAGPGRWELTVRYQILIVKLWVAVDPFQKYVQNNGY